MSNSCHPFSPRLVPQSSSLRCRLNMCLCYYLGSCDVPAVAALCFFVARTSAHHRITAVVTHDGSCLRATRVMSSSMWDPRSFDDCRCFPRTPRLRLANGETAEGVDQLLYRNRDAVVFHHKRGKNTASWGSCCGTSTCP